MPLDKPNLELAYFRLQRTHTARTCEGKLDHSILENTIEAVQKDSLNFSNAFTVGMLNLQADKAWLSYSLYTQPNLG